MNTLSYPNNPRVTRALAHSARTRAKSDRTGENIVEALKYDGMLEKGPKKSRAMGRSALGRAVGRDVVAFVHWTAVDPQTGEGNIGGVLISGELAEQVRQEVALNRTRKNSGDERYDKWHRALGSPYRWAAGTPPDRRVGFLASIPLSEALNFPTQTHDMDGSPREVDPGKTVYAAMKNLFDSRR